MSTDTTPVFLYPQRSVGGLTRRSAKWPRLAAVRAAARRAGRRRHSRRFSSTPGALRAHDAPPRRRSSSFTSAGVQLNLALQPRPRCFVLCLLPARRLGSRRTTTRRSRASRWSRRPGSMVKVRPPPQAHAERAEHAEGAEGRACRGCKAPLPLGCRGAAGGGALADPTASGHPGAARVAERRAAPPAAAAPPRA